MAVSGQRLLAIAGVALAVAACEPRVALEAPKEPITINLNIKIEQEVRIKVERDLEELFKTDKKIF
ncbi:YnbE family lipoprotein [Thalassobaculum fulvum]|uniref:YnbE family lipoprotein n=1 Tax=Thalassobaculum fulvum TaxID=1633335 RepID=A0A918XWL6_9PROT|nr:YnbE family lipoprotein [Thalassobaculum fulvum]GHD59601.1 YnbE family lipoprotein [Thalassobaculum fulvum]